MKDERSVAQSYCHLTTTLFTFFISKPVINEAKWGDSHFYSHFGMKSVLSCQ